MKETAKEEYQGLFTFSSTTILGAILAVFMITQITLILGNLILRPVNTKYAKL